MAKKLSQSVCERGTLTYRAAGCMCPSAPDAGQPLPANARCVPGAAGCPISASPPPTADHSTPSADPLSSALCLSVERLIYVPGMGKNIERNENWKEPNSNKQENKTENKCAHAVKYICFKCVKNKSAHICNSRSMHNWKKTQKKSRQKVVSIVDGEKKK